jgi:hypothetical protein
MSEANADSVRRLLTTTSHALTVFLPGRVHLGHTP